MNHEHLQCHTCFDLLERGVAPPLDRYATIEDVDGTHRFMLCVNCGHIRGHHYDGRCVSGKTRFVRADLTSGAKYNPLIDTESDSKTTCRVCGNSRGNHYSHRRSDGVYATWCRPPNKHENSDVFWAGGNPRFVHPHIIATMPIDTTVYEESEKSSSEPVDLQPKRKTFKVVRV